MMTVHEVSERTGVSIRTLQYYDRIGLLQPAHYTGAGYRLYGEAELETLQQILLFRELEFPLKEIRRILRSPSFDRQKALDQQIALLQPKILICLGRHAAKELIREDFQISSEHGQWFEKNGILMTAVFHPAALLRDMEKGPETFEDLKEIQRMIRKVCPEVLEGWTPGAF